MPQQTVCRSSRGSLARRHVASTATAAAFVLVASALASACLVSFDGYQPLAAGTGGQLAGGGNGAAGKSSSGGKNSGGMAGDASSGGEAGDRDPGSSAGEGGSAGSGNDAGSGGVSVAGGGAGGTSVAGSGGSGGSDPVNCPANLEGPPLIEIPKPGGGFFCMDRTEVTNQDYAAFLASNPSTANQAAACSFNDSFEPDTSAACAAEEIAKYDPVARPKVPVGCVDWCDAKRYCEWTGKRLCGAIGGGPSPTGSFADAAVSQWYRACSKGGAQKFPYGNSYQATYCNGADVAGYHPAPVANLPACTGGYTGLFDMSGNVAEWEDSCSAASGANDNCLIRGGSIDNIDVLTPSLLCNSSVVDDTTPSPATAKRNAKNELIGIRCCLDP